MQDPLKPIDVVLVEPFCRDPALDPEMDLEAYRAERRSELIKERPGMKAARFRVGPIMRTYLAEKIGGMAGEDGRNTLAFLAAVHAYVDASGTAHRAETNTGAYDQPIATPAWLDEVANEFGMDAVRELGRVARVRAELPKARAARWG